MEQTPLFERTELEISICQVRQLSSDLDLALSFTREDPSVKFYSHVTVFTQEYERINNSTKLD